MTLPNLLSSSRYVLAMPMAYLVWFENWISAAVILWIAIGTDLADGYFARKHHQITPLGGFLDHSSDATFVTFLLLALTHHGYTTIALPIIVPLAFVQYTVDSRILDGFKPTRQLKASSLGRYNGICYFILGGFPVMQHSLGVYILPEHSFIWISWGLVLSTAISMVDRVVTLFSHQRSINQSSINGGNSD